MPKPNQGFTGFPKSRQCNLCGSDYPAFSPSSLYCKDCRNTMARTRNREYLNRKRAKLSKPLHTQPVLLNICYWCLGGCSPGTKCRECGTEYSAEKARIAWERQIKGYMDIVREGAERKGEDVKKALEKVSRWRMAGGYFEKQKSWKLTNNKLKAFLRRKNRTGMYENKYYEMMQYNNRKYD